jgi:hypothetical protein
MKPTSDAQPNQTAREVAEKIHKDLADTEELVSPDTRDFFESIIAAALEKHVAGYGGAHADFMRLSKQHNELKARLTLAEGLAEQWKDCAEYGWAIIANAGAGNWARESKDWQEAAARFRDQYHTALARWKADQLTPPSVPKAKKYKANPYSHPDSLWASMERIALLDPSLQALPTPPSVRPDDYPADTPIGPAEVAAAPTPPDAGPSDPAMLDWLEKQGADCDYDEGTWVIYTHDSSLGNGDSKGAHKTLRAAIRAAMTEDAL